jgi:hypothetical protein
MWTLASVLLSEVAVEAESLKSLGKVIPNDPRKESIAFKPEFSTVSATTSVNVI